MLDFVKAIARNWRTVAYFILFFACIGLLAHTLYVTWDPKTSSGQFFPVLGLGTIASLLASGILMLFITYRDSTRLAEIEQAIKRLAPLGDSFALGEVEAVLRNVEVKPEKWLSLIFNLESEANAIYFVGSSLRRWRTRSIYSTPLANKLRLRMLLAHKSKSKDSRKRTHQTYFCVTDANAVVDWRSFIGAEVLAGFSGGIEDFGLHVVLLNPGIPYSAVCGSASLAVTPYTATRNVDESISVFLRRSGDFYKLYSKDIEDSIIAASAKA